MSNKTCGECRFFEVAPQFCISNGRTASALDDACKDFAKPTKGDVIRQGDNRRLAEIFDDFYNGNKCKYCINYISGNCKFDDKHAEYDEGGWVEDEDCISGFEAWLNAPAESQLNDAIQNVIKDGAKNAIDIHEAAYAPDMNVATKESEGEDE